MACGNVTPKADAGGTDSASTPDAGSGCTANSFSCGEDDALYQCDADGAALSKVQDCQYGCDVDHCRDCEANTTFCSADDLVMCSADGTIENPQTCEFGCQMDRCNTCEPGAAYCDNSNAVTCGLDGEPGATMSCGAAGCTGGVCNACTPNTTTCQNDTLVVCNGNGTVQSATPCALGCGATPNPHCKALVPSYGVSAPTGTLPDLHIDDMATLSIANCNTFPYTASLTIGTTNTSITGAQVDRVTQNGGPPICVVRFGKITIDAGKTLTVVNDGGFGTVLSLQSTGDILINGTVAFSNSSTGPAPGTQATVVGSSSSGELAPGAGGAGAARAGGTGGACNGCAGMNHPGRTGGPAITTIDTVLTPGSKGGNVVTGGSVAIGRGNGGAGGGAIQLVSLTRVSIGATGQIVLNGKGGSGPQYVRALGAGGGSGGTLVIEAPAVSLSAGSLAVANGGGAAGGCPTCMDAGGIVVCDGPDGEDGQLSATRAAGGLCVFAGAGGYEANGSTSPSPNGQNADGNAISGGGGGGSSGFIIIRARTAANIMVVGGAVVSPPPTLGSVVAN